MKHLLATTAVLLTAGIASAEVTTTGTSRMGVIDDFASDAAFSSRVRIIFTASGESDNGLAFGATVRNDQSGVGNDANGDSTVFISGAFGKLSMGDVDGAAAAAVGQVDGVGYTGLSDMNEIVFIGTGGNDYNDSATIGPDDTQDTSVLYEYSTGNFALYLSSTQINRAQGGEALSVAGKYTAGNYTVSLGYEQLDAIDDYLWEQFVLGGTATFGAVALKAVYADGSNNQGDAWKQYAVSAAYTVNALTVSAFAANDEDLLSNDLGTTSNAKAYGLGASYDLGGGAKIQGGYVKNQTNDTSAVDLGLTFSF